MPQYVPKKSPFLQFLISSQGMVKAAALLAEVKFWLKKCSWIYAKFDCVFYATLDEQSTHSVL